jgi:hypothetical protein
MFIMGKTKTILHKVYKISEIELKPTGKKFEIKGRLLPYGTPLYGVYNLNGRRIYPYYDETIDPGATKENCQRWINESCWFPEDKAFRIKTLNRMSRFEPGQKLENLVVVRNDLVYDGNRHNEYRIIFRENDKHFKFDVVENEVGMFYVGKWMSPGLKIDKSWYLCKRVYPHERKVTVVEFKLERE